MAITQAYSGTLTSSTTEQSFISGNTTLQSSTTAGVYQLMVDLSALAAGDSVRIRVKEKAISTATQYAIADETYAGPLSAPLYSSPSFILMDGWDMTLVQVGGTARSIPYSIRQVA